MLRTSPLQIVPADLKILSMIRHVDLVMYLVAVKSFYQRIGFGEIVLIDDGTLHQNDYEIIGHHLGSPQIIPLDRITTDPCPRGGCWERLLSVVDFSSKYFVIQLDSDTLTRGEIPEVLECVKTNRSFALGTQTGREFVSLAEASARVGTTRGSLHVQTEAEKNLHRISNSSTKYYVRASAGFAGFAKGAFSRDHVVAFSQSMAGIIGEKWKEWGSEQVASNYLVANSPMPIVLPFPKYRCFRSQVDPRSAAFLHFVGTHRYDQGVYTRESESVIRRL